MALATARSVALIGMQAREVLVEADLAQGVPGLSITGLPDTSLNEARDRVRSAIVNSGEQWPTTRRITLGLSPASVPKRGTGFDLALAVALLTANGALPEHDAWFLGELGLDGSLRPVPGVLAALVGLEHRGLPVYVPAANLAEARLVTGAHTIGIRSLRELLAVLRGGEVDLPEPAPVGRDEPPRAGDLSDVAGQPVGRFACEVAAAGGHNLLMTGPPGCGKTLLAERLPTILPPLSEQESLEVTAIHSVAGQLPPDVLVSRPPFQAPHHGASVAAIIGGGSGLARPGSVSLAHRGVLFLDEAPEFGRAALDVLRQPLEQGRVTIHRSAGVVSYPARFSLVLAANPCPCARTSSDCTCPPERRRQYLARLSGPLLDRIDATVSMRAITRADALDDRDAETSSQVAARVLQARARAAQRLAGTPWRRNADVPPTDLVRLWPLRREVLRPISEALEKGVLTARGFGRVQRLAWTVADLFGNDQPGPGDVGLALSLRLGDSWQQVVAA